MKKKHLFTSESVTEGHPDKVCDQISDAILDDILNKDPNAHVACETLVKTGLVFIGGEITTETWVDAEQIVRNTIKEIGYDDSRMGFDWRSCAVISAIGKQSPDIAQGVNNHNPEEQGAGVCRTPITAAITAIALEEFWDRKKCRWLSDGAF